MKYYKHALLALDLVEGHEAFVKSAAKFAKVNCEQLSVVHALMPIPSYAGYDLDPIESERIDAAKQEIARLIKHEKVAIENEIITHGSARNVIIEVAKKLKVDLIIVGRHKPDSVSRLLGTTASSVNNHADCDVLTLGLSE